MFMEKPYIRTMLVVSSVVALQSYAAETSLWYFQPARQWHGEALPIGNGRMGAMLFGGLNKERIQFNEQSLWGGGNNWDGSDEQDINKFGSYRNFGNVFVEMGASTPEVTVSSPSGHDSGDGAIEASYGNKGGKWEYSNAGDFVQWQAALPAPFAVPSYSFTSPQDSPERDSREWLLEGSNDGKQWIELDKKKLETPFEARRQTKSFVIPKPVAVRFYRFTFRGYANKWFQIGNIALEGVKFPVAVSSSPSRDADYRRGLDITNGVHTTSYKADGVTYTREAFASRPDQVMIFRYTASKPGMLTGDIQIKPGQMDTTIHADASGILASGMMGNKLKHACKIRAINTGGVVKAGDGALYFEKCDSLLLLMDARTDYKPDYKAGWRGADPVPLIEKEVTAAAGKTYEQLKDAHVRDLSSLMNQVKVSWGKSDAATLALPTDERLQAYKKGGNDPQLERTLFQYGRYLLASCSRPGGLPANLQGLWNNSNNPPWASDYHSNINLQMNYWPAEVTGLSECHLPLFDFVTAALEPNRLNTRKQFGDKTRGWTVRTSQSIFAGNGWGWNVPASAWYAQHFYEHYAFTQDKEFLRKTGYPVVKEICEFWEDRLKQLPDGSLVVPQGWSPEHGPSEDGVVYDQQIVWDLFQNYLDMARALGVDEEYQKKVADMQARMVPNRIGKWGQLQEWQKDIDDPKDLHRHTSHLFAVFPGRQISLTQTPDLAKAAIKSLKARSNDNEETSGKRFAVDTTIADGRQSWTWPWRCALWARLGEAERAGIMVRGLLTYNTLPNLFCVIAPVQLDGNFGLPAAVSEMLIQSHAGEIALLPACPKAWAVEGCFTGLRARGGYTLDCSWKAGKVVSYRLTGNGNVDKKKKVKVRVNGAVDEVLPE
jgi:alpha-L-fucosidase 2